MQIEVLNPAELSAEQMAAWSKLQAADPAFRSPFFRPEFTQAVAAVRDDVEVAVLIEDGNYAGFFPYQRGPGNVASPVGGRLSDYQGFVVRADASWNPQELLDKCHLKAWRFDHLLAVQAPFQPFHCRQAESPCVDLSEGFDAYCVARKKAHESFRRALQRGRKLDREVGPLRLVYRVQDPNLLNTLIEWKTRQYRETNVANVFAVNWTRELLEQVLLHNTSDFSGVLIALYAGERLVALQLGMASGDTFHNWFPGYDPELRSVGNYSPGLVLMLEVARSAAQHGLRMLDLGKGSETYKQDFMNHSVPLAEGFIDRRLIQRTWKNTLWSTRNWVRSTRLRAPVKAAADAVAPWFASRLFR